MVIEPKCCKEYNVSYKLGTIGI